MNPELTKYWSRDSSVGIVKGYGLDGRCLIPGRSSNFSFLHRVQTGSETHSLSYGMDTGGGGGGFPHE
jgi:hypothetical protein